MLDQGADPPTEEQEKEVEEEEVEQEGRHWKNERLGGIEERNDIHKDITGVYGDLMTCDLKP